MYPDIGGNASAPNAPGFNLNFDEKQPPYAPYQPPPPYSGPGYPGVPMPQAQPQPQPPTIVIQQPDRRQGLFRLKLISLVLNFVCFNSIHRYQNRRSNCGH